MKHIVVDFFRNKRPEHRRNLQFHRVQDLVQDYSSF